ncbi:7525_t:CDS:2, partial [Entrophospora sp. SA101]
VDFGGGKNDVGRSDGRDNNNHKKSGKELKERSLDSLRKEIRQHLIVILLKQV